ncbi:MAG: hypothetical protein ABI852_02160 [Gemmatimonadaceae bacterium]
MPGFQRLIALLSSAFAITALVGCDKFLQAATKDTCVRPPEKLTAVGAVMNVSDSTNFPCTIDVVDAGITLKLNTEVSSFSYTVARGPDGRFYTSPVKIGAQLHVWNADGTFQQNFGQPGEAPGDLAAGPKFVQFDSSGRIYVGDNNRRWSVFNSALEFVASIPASETGIRGNGATGELLSDGSFLSTVHASTGSFTVFDFSSPDGSAPPVLRAFGPPIPPGISSARRVSHSGGDTFWAGPLSNAGQGYVLEQWRTDGTLLKTIRRPVSWVPAGIAGTDSGGGAPHPDLQMLHEDGSGVLLVSWMIFRPDFARLTAEERGDFTPGKARDKSIDVYFEAIDANAGVVLASAGPVRPSSSFGHFPIGYFRGTREGYVRQENSKHVVSIRMTKTLLIKR